MKTEGLFPVFIENPMRRPNITSPGKHSVYTVPTGDWGHDTTREMSITAKKEGESTELLLLNLINGNYIQTIQWQRQPKWQTEFFKRLSGPHWREETKARSIFKVVKTCPHFSRASVRRKSL